MVDRIWLEESGSTAVIREAIVQVDETSANGLSGLRALMTLEADEVTDISDTLCDADHFLNKRGRRGTYNVDIGFAPVRASRIARVQEARISQYQFSNVVVFDRVDTRLGEFLDARMLCWTFPRVVAPGERVMVRTFFSVPHHLDDDREGDCAHLQLKYFDLRIIPEAVDNIDFVREEIPVVLEEDGVPCGLDVSVFVPTNLLVQGVSPENHETQSDTAGPQGSDGSHYVLYVWHAREQVSQTLLAERTRLGFDLTGICRKYSTGKDVKELQADVSHLQAGTRFATVLGILSIMLAIGGILLTLGLAIWSRAESPNPSKPVGHSVSTEASISKTLP